MNEAFAIGTQFPEYSAACVVPDGNGGATVETKTNADFAGRRLILFFYPKDATCGCTTEAQGFRDLHGEFEKLNVQVVGVSRDSVGAHKKFIANQQLPFPLLCDRDRVLAAQLGLLVQKTMYGKPVTGSLRTTYAIDENGVIRHIWPRVEPDGHAAEVLAWCRQNASS